MSNEVVTPEQLRELMPRGDIRLLDVRRDSELCAGVIPGAQHLALHLLEQYIAENVPDRDSVIVVYCASGVRSVQAQQVLLHLGYRRVSHLQGGWARWQALGFPADRHRVEPCAVAAPDRYARQSLLDEVGSAGQDRIRRARILLVGLGGLGSPAALYLAGAGVGTLGLVDSDAVELSNLHRQILHDTVRVGTSKVESAKRRIAEVNPDVKVMEFDQRLGMDNIERILDSGWDVVLDGADNFPTRYLLNEVCSRRDIPLCHGSIDRFEGRVTTFRGRSGPCYRCLFPRPPRPGVIGACSERGVLGVLPGMIGVLQATEALKLILGIGQVLVGRLLTYDALELRFREMRYGADPNCPTCSTRGMMVPPCK